jgi:hypothetical protein
MGTEVFRLSKALTAITFTNQAKGRLILLPIGALLRPSGKKSLTGLIEVMYQYQPCMVFERDLLARAERFQNMATAAS